MICPKCRYERKASDDAPDWQCPSCGVAYAKVSAAVPKQTDPPKADASARVKACPYCGEEILAVAKKCKHCQTDLTRPSAGRSSVQNGHGIALLTIPIVASFLIWFWVGSMNLMQSPGSFLSLIGFGTVLSTAIIAAMEASLLGMTSDRRKGTYSPGAWFAIIALMWFIGYPAYLYKRRHFGQPSYLVVSLLVAAVFLASLFLMELGIQGQVDTVQGLLNLPG